MARRRKARSKNVETPPPTPSPSAVPLWKKPWPWFVGSIAALALLLTNINTILSNLRLLPSEVRKTSDQFHEWYGEYDAWKGHWSSFPEGLVNMEALNLSDEDFRIDIDETKEGIISGTIETTSICDKTPVFQELLLEGEISSAGHARADVFDFIGGHRRVFARIRLLRDDYIMTIVPEDDPAGLFSKGTRIARDPNEFGGVGDRPSICGDKREKFFMEAVRRAEEAQGVGTTDQVPQLGNVN